MFSSAPARITARGVKLAVMRCPKNNDWFIALGLLLITSGVVNTVFDLKATAADLLDRVPPAHAAVERSSASARGDISGGVLTGVEETTDLTPRPGPDKPAAPQRFYAPLQPDVDRNQTPPAQPEALEPQIPLRLIVPKISLEAPVVPVESQVVKLAGKEFNQWVAPDQFASGWQESSAHLGEPGNTVLNGHHNVYGEVFKRLVELEVGDELTVQSESHAFVYVISNKMILPEKYASLEERTSNARWILPSEDERLTLITCWPYESNTHRLIIVAKPIAIEELNRTYR